MRIFFALWSISLLSMVVGLRNESPKTQRSGNSLKSNSNAGKSTWSDRLRGSSLGQQLLKQAGAFKRSASSQKDKLVRQLTRGDYLDRNNSFSSFTSTKTSSAAKMRAAATEFRSACNEKCSSVWGYHFISDYVPFNEPKFSMGNVIPITKGQVIKKLRSNSGGKGWNIARAAMIWKQRPQYSCECTTTAQFLGVLKSLNVDPARFEAAKNEPENALDVVYPAGRKSYKFQHVDHETLVKIIVQEMQEHMEDPSFTDSDFDQRVAALGWCDAETDHDFPSSLRNSASFPSSPK